MGDRPYVLEAGFETSFSKALLSALATLSVDELVSGVVTIEPVAGDSDEVLFVNAFCNGAYIRGRYDESTSFPALVEQICSKLGG